jgi:hypothetical protein
MLLMESCVMAETTEALVLLDVFLRPRDAGDVWLRKVASGCWTSSSSEDFACFLLLRDLRGDVAGDLQGEELDMRFMVPNYELDCPY